MWDLIERYIKWEIYNSTITMGDLKIYLLGIEIISRKVSKVAKELSNIFSKINPININKALT